MTKAHDALMVTISDRSLKKKLDDLIPETLNISKADVGTSSIRIVLHTEIDLSDAKAKKVAQSKKDEELKEQRNCRLSYVRNLECNSTLEF